MENNINNESLKLETAKQVTLPYTATRDCFFGWWATTVNQGKWYIYYTVNGNTRKYPYSFSGNTSFDVSGWFPLKKGDVVTMESGNYSNMGTFNYYVM